MRGALGVGPNSVEVFFHKAVAIGVGGIPHVIGGHVGKDEGHHTAGGLEVLLEQIVKRDGAAQFIAMR